MASKRWERPVTISAPVTPRSLNRSNHPRSHYIFLREKKAWQRMLEGLLLATELPRDGSVAYVHADALLRFPQRRDRDEGNFRAVLEKALGDALQAGRWLENDTTATFRFGMVVFDPDRGPARTRVRIAWRRY